MLQLQHILKIYHKCHEYSAPAAVYSEICHRGYEYSAPAAVYSEKYITEAMINVAAAYSENILQMIGIHVLLHCTFVSNF